jgi:DNA-directed RNA polymerase subunit M/transcription elongation factor TFIIS
MKTNPELTPYACPKCGNTGENEQPIIYTEQAALLRNVAGLSNDGTLYVQAQFHVNDPEIIPSGLRCSKCNHEWEISNVVELVDAQT